MSERLRSSARRSVGARRLHGVVSFCLYVSSATTTTSVRGYAPPAPRASPRPADDATTSLREAVSEIGRRRRRSTRADPPRPRRNVADGTDLFDDVDDDDDDDMVSRVRREDIAPLREGTGSEVLDAELQLRLDAAARRRRRAERDGAASTPSSVGDALAASSYAAAFVEATESEASTAEKFAMKMIPLQLPSPVCRDADGRETEVDDGGERRVGRLSPRREAELARVVRRGAEAHRVKAAFEREHQRPISRKEWAALADAGSPASLRRLVSSYRVAKNELVTANLGLVYAVVKQQKRRGATEEELVQEGTLGLVRAAELFDPEQGVRFSTYATIWIKGVLGNTKVDQTIAVPNRERAKWNKVRRARDELAARRADDDGADVTVADVAARVGLREDEVADLVERVPRARNLLSLDHRYVGATRGGAEDRGATGLYGVGVENDRDDEDLDGRLAETIFLRADVVAALARSLDPREARLMRLRYGLRDGRARTIAECAECMGLSRQRVQQLAVRCLAKLREADDNESLQEYLLTVA